MYFNEYAVASLQHKHIQIWHNLIEHYEQMTFKSTNENPARQMWSLCLAAGSNGKSERILKFTRTKVISHYVRLIASVVIKN